MGSFNLLIIQHGFSFNLPILQPGTDSSTWVFSQFADSSTWVLLICRFFNPELIRQHGVFLNLLILQH